MLRVMAGLVAFNLSYAPPVEGLVQHAHNPNNTRLVDNNPFSGDRGFDIIPELEKFTDHKDPVPYYEIWNNAADQTAQQMVAICSLLQEEAAMYCEIPSMGYPVKK